MTSLMISVAPVSTASIIGMVFTLLISTIVPIAACIAAALKWKGRAKISSAFIGVAVFILFAMVLERILHVIVLGNTGALLTGNIVLYAVYGGLAAGLFEETGRFLAMKFLMKNNLSRENAILYGIGHGGIEAILIVGLTYVNNLVYSALINSGALSSLLSSYDASTRLSLQQQLGVLGATPAFRFYLAGVERIGAIVLHIALSYLVYLAVKKRRISLYILSVFLHAFLNAGIVIISQKLSVVLSEILLLAAVLLIAVILFRYEKNAASKDRSSP